VTYLMAAGTALFLYGVIRWGSSEDLTFRDAVAWLSGRADLEQILRSRRERRDLQRLRGRR
jgi:hypothetical protein